MSPEQEVSNGIQADRLMNDLKPYLEVVKGAILTKWETSPVGDKEGQHELRLLRKLLNDLEINIKTAIETGKLASIQIERESLLERAKNNIRKFG